MLELNGRLYDEFKRLDKLFEEIYGKRDDGRLNVNSYLDDMRENFEMGKCHVISWSDDFASLKRIKAIRNDLGHGNVSFTDDVCTEDDVIFLTTFYKRMLNGTDPISVLKKRTSEEDTKPSPKKQIESHQPLLTVTEEEPPKSPLGCIIAVAIVIASLILAYLVAKL